jgi:hypothetical protein
MPAAKKKPPRLAIVAPAGRDALALAIENVEKAKLALSKQNDAIALCRDEISGADEQLAKLNADVAKAEHADLSRAASILVDSPKTPVSRPWSAEKARGMVSIAKETQSHLRRVLEKLEADVAGLEDELWSAEAAVTCAIKAITRPTVEKLVGELRAAKRVIAMSEGILGELLLSVTSPRFHDLLREKASVDAVDAVLGDLREECRRMSLQNYLMVHRPDALAAGTAWSRVLAELRENPAAPLPGED